MTEVHLSPEVEMTEAHLFLVAYPEVEIQVAHLFLVAYPEVLAFLQYRLVAYLSPEVEMTEVHLFPEVEIQDVPTGE